MSEETGHLPLYGPGPWYVATIVALTLAGIAGTLLGVLPVVEAGGATMALRVLGGALAAGGVALWVAAVFGARIDEGITANHLVTTGVYAVVRNPIYTAFSLACTGALLICGNLWLLVLPPLFWAFLTVLMRVTEERWLRDLYGQEYVDYCARVNRCIPWFPRK